MNRRSIPVVPTGGLDLTFYPSLEDLAFLEEIRSVAAGRPIIVIAPGAGELARNIPVPILEAINHQLVTIGCFPVQVGRNYLRGARQEPLIAGGCFDAIDRLSVPGTARLVQSSAGLVTAHSSLNILGWFLRKPQLVLAPARVFDQHLARPTRWGFGAPYPETIATRFEDFNGALLGRFADIARDAAERQTAEQRVV